MKRFALLIDASNVKGLNPLPGAEKDIENWVTFLTSDLGGKWCKESEIFTLKKPLSTKVEGLLSSNASKYCFVAFAGHGFHDPNRGDYVCLNDNDMSCPISTITPISEKGTLVVDACRGIEDAYIVEAREIIKLSAHKQYLTMANDARTVSESQKVSFSYPSRSDYRILFEKSILSSSSGVVKMLSCSVGEAADDIKVNNEDIGGIYTTILVKSALNWEKSYSTARVYSTKEAHDDTVSYMKRNYPEQNPKYSPSYLKHPFAVR